MPSIKLSNRIRKNLILIGLFCNPPLLFSLFFYSGCSPAFPNSCLLGRFFISLAAVLLIRNIVLMSRHDWYRTTYNVTKDELEAIADSGKRQVGKWKELVYISGRTQPKRSYGQILIWASRDVFLLGRDVVLRFSNGVEIRIPRVGMSYVNHPIINKLAIPGAKGNLVEKLLYEWTTWNEWLHNDRLHRKFGDFPSRDMRKWYIIPQLPWILVGMLYLGLNFIDISPDDIFSERWDRVAYVFSPITFVITASIHFSLWLKQRR